MSFNKNRIISFCLTIAMLFSTLNIFAAAVNTAEDENIVHTQKKEEIFLQSVADDFEWELSETGDTLTIRGNGAMPSCPWKTDSSTVNSVKKVVIEDGITDIPKNAFYEYINITDAIIPDSVESIGDYAFYGCKSLMEIIIPGSVKRVGYRAFAACESLSELIISDGVETIDATAFGWCTSLEEVVIPGSADMVGNDVWGGTFNGCTGLTSVTISEGVSNIAAYAFRGCTGITEITIPGSIETIGTNAFYGCTGLRDLTISDGVKVIDFTAFSGCIGLTEVNIPESVTSIGGYAFYECTSLSEVNIPEGVTSIKEYTFYGCTNLSGINIPDSVESIGEYAFFGCTELTEVTIPSTVKEIEWSAFYDCTNLVICGYPGSAAIKYAKNTGINYRLLGDFKFELSDDGTLTVTGTGNMPEGWIATEDFDSRKIIKLVIGTNLTSISESAFSGCTNLEEVNIPDSIKTIGKSAFEDCRSLKKIDIPDSVTSIGDSAFAYSGLTEIIIPDSVTSIGDSAFAYSGLTEIIIPNSVTHIGTDIFEYCESLENVTIPDSVTSINGAFSYCRSLKKITIPDSITSMEGAFISCTGLTEITIPDSVINMEGAFAWCTSLTEITIPNNVTSIKDAFSGCTGLTGITIPDGVTNIEGAFSGCTGLTGITIPESVTSIGESAFNGCTGLNEITIPDSVTSIGFYAFRECENLRKINIPEGVTYIGGSAFSYCTSLTDMTIPDGVKKIESATFYGCTGLRSVSIPDSVTYIGSEAFSNCTNLKEIIISDSVTYIGWGAFEGCDSLKIICLAGSYAEEYAIENNIDYVYFGEVFKGIVVKITNQNGDVITDGLTINWYEKDSDDVIVTGTTLQNYDPRKKYQFEIVLSEDLSYVYYQPERQDVVFEEDNNEFGLVLENIEMVTATGVIVSDDVPVSNASITFEQNYNNYKKEITVTTNANGSFSSSIANVPTKLIISANGYYKNESIAIANRLTGNTCELDNISLIKLPENKITFTISKTEVKKGDENPLEIPIMSVNGISFNIKNVTTGKDITEFEVQYPNIIIGDLSVNGGDTVEITAVDKKGIMTAAPVTVELDDQKMGSCSIEFVENGYVEVSGISGNPDNYVFVFDKEGNYVNTYSVKQNLKSDRIAEGEYTLLFIKKTDLLRSVKKLDRLSDFGLAEDIDYITKNITVETGKVTTVENVVVPVLDESKLYYTVEEKTKVTVNNSSAVVGRYVTVRVEYKIDEKHYSQGERVNIELPEEVSFIDNSLSVNGKIHPYSVADKNISVQTNVSEGVIRFYVYSTEIGRRDINAYLSFNNGETNITQPLGTATITFESAKISVLNRTGVVQTTVTGTASPQSKVIVYDNDVCVGTTTANKVGSWLLTFELVSPGTYSYHDIYADIESKNVPKVITDTETLVYEDGYVDLKEITMIHQFGELVFDFINPKPTESYTVSSAFDFTFLVKFDGDSSNLKNVYVTTKGVSNDIVKIPVTYDRDKDMWIGKHHFTSSTAPVSVGASWDYGPDNVQMDVTSVPTNDYFEEMIEEIREGERVEELIEEEAKKENPDFDQFVESEGNEMSPEEEAELEAKYSEMDTEDLKQEFYELEAMCDADISSMDDIFNQMDSYSTDYSITSELEETGDIIDYTIKTCDGINEGELESEGYTKHTDAVGEAYYTKSTDTCYSYINFNENVYMEMDYTSAVDLLSVELLSDDAVSKWRKVAGNVLTGVQQVRNFLNARELWFKDRIAEALKQFNNYEKRVNDCKLLIRVYSSNPRGELVDDVEKLLKEYKRLERDKALYFSRVKRFDDLYKKFIKLAKVSPVFQYLTMTENIAMKLQQYCDLYDSTIPCENDAEKAENIRNQLITSAQVMVSFCIGTGVIFISCVNPTTLFAGLVAMAAEYAVCVATDKLINKNLNSFRQRISNLKCTKDPDEENENGFGNGNGNGEGGGQSQDANPTIDPSGFVYEAVPSNRVEGVKAECYYYDYPLDDFGMQGENKEDIFWAAEEYDQINPLYTDEDGRYAWDVPPGEWLVKFSKDGYYNTDSKKDIAANENGYLPVPPPQTEVNTAIVSKSAPEVEAVNVYDNEIQIIFSQYMQIDSVNTTNIKVTSGESEVSGTISPVNAEFDYNEENQYASVFAFVPDEKLTGTADVEISNVKNYAGKALSNKLSQSKAVTVKPEGLSISAEVDVPYNSGALVEIQITPKEAGANKTLTVSTSSPSIVGVVNNKVTTDENGKANVMLSGNLPGEGNISITLDGTDIKAETRAVVGNIVDTSNSCAKVKASIEGGSTVAKGTKLTFSTATEGAEIYYTLDGTCPCIEDSKSRIKYTGPITINEDMFIIAYAVKEGLEDSATAGFVYTVGTVLEKVAVPVANPKGGSVTSGTSVTLTTSTENAKIYYTTNGSTPTEQSAVYTNPIKITSATIIKAIAFKDGMAASDVMSESYTIKSNGGGGGAGGGGGGSRGGSSKPTVPEAETEPEQTDNTKEFDFKDVKASDWYYEAVKFAFEKGITSGVSEESYAPNDKVTRGQFITMLCRAYGIEEMTGDNFADCGNTWYTGYLAAAKQLGISSGVGDNKFVPEAEITREEMVTLIYNYLKSTGEVGEENQKKSFADDNNISDWAKSAVDFASGKGYVSGKENDMFDPKGKATRAELAQIFFNIFTK